MDIGFSEEQELLRDTARKFLDSACTTKFVRERMAKTGERYAAARARVIRETTTQGVNSIGRCNSSTRRSCNGCFKTTSI